VRPAAYKFRLVSLANTTVTHMVHPLRFIPGLPRVLRWRTCRLNWFGHATARTCRALCRAAAAIYCCRGGLVYRTFHLDASCCRACATLTCVSFAGILSLFGFTRAVPAFRLRSAPPPALDALVPFFAARTSFFQTKRAFPFSLALSGFPSCVCCALAAGLCASATLAGMVYLAPRRWRGSSSFTPLRAARTRSTMRSAGRFSCLGFCLGLRTPRTL